MAERRRGGGQSGEVGSEEVGEREEENRQAKGPNGAEFEARARVEEELEGDADDAQNGQGYSNGGRVKREPTSEDEGKMGLVVLQDCL